MKTNFNEFKFNLTFKGKKPSPRDPENKLYFVLKVINTKLFKYETFDFWKGPYNESLTNGEVVRVFHNIVHYAIVSRLPYEEFCDITVCDPQQETSRAHYKFCIETRNKLERVYRNELEPLEEELYNYAYK